LEVPVNVIQQTMLVVGGIAWGKIKRAGKLRNEDEIDVAIEKRNWRTLISIVDYANALQKEKRGEAVIGSVDESYCHATHHSDFSFLLIGKENVTQHEVYCAVRDGLRICMQGIVTRWGPIAIDGVEDCQFLNAAGEENKPGSRFKELNNLGEPRDIYKCTEDKSLSKLKLSELQERAMQLGVSLLDDLGVELTKKPLYARVKPIADVHLANAKARNGGAPGCVLSAEQKAQQLLSTNWDELYDQYSDCAHTTIRFMIANQHSGDYHDNFDHVMFFKHMVVTSIVYPLWCRQQQFKMDANTLYPRSDYNFYEFDDETKTTGNPTRQFITFMDNAPYHHGGAANVNSWSKKFILEVLQDKNITSIPTKLPDGSPLLVEVPEKGSAGWPSGHPNAEQVRKGAIAELKIINPTMFEPPWQLVLDKANSTWGGLQNKRPRGGGKWWVNYFTAPYTPTFWPIELMWAFGKNYAALAQNQKVGRSPAEAITILRKRFCEPGKKYEDVWEKSFLHCEKCMNAWIEINKRVNGCQLGGTVGSPTGMPTAEEYKEWCIYAGMGENDNEIDDAGMFVGEEIDVEIGLNNHDEEIDI
jgi:hypothetical protein